MMIAGVWGGIMFSVRILARSSSLLLIGVCVLYTAGSSSTRVSRGIVGRVVRAKDTPMILITTTMALLDILWDRVVENWEEVDEFRVGGSIYEPSMDTMRGDRYLVSRSCTC